MDFSHAQPAHPVNTPSFHGSVTANNGGHNADVHMDYGNQNHAVTVGATHTGPNNVMPSQPSTVYIGGRINFG
jgi:hypothetical protein